MTHKIVYGFAPDLPAFQQLTPTEAAAALRDTGSSGVFMHQPTPEWADALHAAGLKLYTAVGCFSGADVWERFPESRPVLADGSPAPQEDWYVPAIPTVPQLRADRLGRIEALAASLPLDGLWLDAIRWPCKWEHAEARPNVYPSSFDPLTLRRFSHDTAIALPEAPAEAAAILLREPVSTRWYRWRCDQIADFVMDAWAILKRHRPDALLGVFTVPWAGDDFDSGLVCIVGQDPALLSPYVDVFSPMVYHRLCGRDAAWVGRTAGWLRAQTDRAVWPIIEVLDDADVYPAEAFNAACSEGLAASTGGIMAFTLEGLLRDPARVAVWKGI